jgi:hypothetical protein
MKMLSGNYRLAIFVGPLVIKLVRPRLIVGLFKNFLKALMGLRMRAAFLYMEMDLGYIKQAIFQNWTEYRCWKRCKASFLVPTYFSLGFVNFQKKCAGDHPNWKSSSEFLTELEEVTGRQVWQIDHHCCGIDNYILTPNGMMIVDYGDSRSGSLRFTHLIIKHHKELAPFFKNHH